MSIRTKTRLARWAHLGLFAGLGVIFFFQAQVLLKAPTEGTSLASSISQSMQARLSGVSQGIISYLQNHDIGSLERIKSEGKEASRLLGDFKDAARQSGSVASYERVEKAHEEMRKAALNLLDLDHAVASRRQALAESNAALMSILTDRIGPSIKTSQLNTSARRRAVRSAVDAAKNVSKSHTSRGELDALRERFRQAMVVYRDQSRTRRAGQWADQANTLFDQNADESRDLQDSEQKKQEVFDLYVQKRDALNRILQANHAGEGGFRIYSFKQLFTPGLAFTLFAATLLLAGAILVILSGHRAETEVVGPLQELLQCVEAAASGDVTRVPQLGSSDEVGQLSAAVGRLITVLSRSENLVYHLAALVESSGEAIISQNLDGTILSWNKGAQRIYGYSAEEVKGRPITLLSPNDGGGELMGYLRRIRNGERFQPFETIHQASNGRTVRAFVRVAPIHDSTRKIIGATFCAQDLTETDLLKPRSIESKQIS